MYSKEDPAVLIRSEGVYFSLIGEKLPLWHLENLKKVFFQSVWAPSIEPTIRQRGWVERSEKPNDRSCGSTSLPNRGCIHSTGFTRWTILRWWRRRGWGRFGGHHSYSGVHRKNKTVYLGDHWPAFLQVESMEEESEGSNKEEEKMRRERRLATQVNWELKLAMDLSDFLVTFLQEKLQSNVECRWCGEQVDSTW